MNYDSLFGWDWFTFHPKHEGFSSKAGTEPILPTGTFFTRKHRANARAGLPGRDRLRGSEVESVV